MVNKKDNTASSVSDSLRNKFFTGASINEEPKTEKKEVVKKEKVSKNTNSKKSNTSSGDVITSSFQIKKNPNRGKTRLNIVLTQDQADKLKRLSKETGYSMSGFLGELIDQIDF
ncbi:MAG: hypothetical protein E7G36_05130 [Peptoniphilus rhinitidis]|uniref:hypothetical protein n=1 Tax=Peptoniphilus rhinitidis TaxID=1175452 RepID=UPI0029014811|nr:hypothetical protein [Peptoniphilus rhinitidis]MDU2110241.1 hypothetical protein [Peptoniphilus lacydonensis]MDU3751088.1 hypothetical protein [Peptoniphilus rhinitidis]